MVENIFADEWRECLRAHYKHVIRNNDHVTEPSLRVVMHQAGFDESELAELRVLATMHIDDSGADFVPELDVLETTPDTTEDVRVFTASLPPAAAEEADLLPADVYDAQAQATIEDELPVEDAQLDETFPEEANAVPDEDDPDAPSQLTLF